MAIVLDPVNGITQASWTTAGRPGSPVAGQVGFNTSLNALEQYTGSAWETIPTWSTANRPVSPVAGYSGYNIDTKAFEFYNGTSWIGFNQSNLSTPASYLLIAGGGSGGGVGGGGAGGLLTGTVTLTQATSYTVTVGAGGASFVSPSQQGNLGGNSVLSGSGITTVTASGGGGGGGIDNPWTNGVSGGSGGGGGSNNGRTGTGGSGTPGQGNTGGNANNSTTPSTANGGGGGGSSAVGQNAPAGSTGGNGGAGTASSISGTPATYAGGGGGGAYVLSGTGTAGTGGSGGGGNGGRNGLQPTSGTANTGGGGGGSGLDSSGNFLNRTSGGGGIAIISYPGAQAFTGGLITSSGGNTIHTFTSSGTLTPLSGVLNINNSLRFRRSASAYLSRTPASASNRKTFTWSGWVKRGEISVAGTNDYALMCVRPSPSSYTLFSIRSANAGTGAYAIIFEDSASTAVLATSNKFRDTAAWYHFVLAVDTTQATASNRVKIYVNNQQVTSFDTYNTYPTLNSDMLYNTANAHNIGRDPYDTGVQFDGYMANVHFIDGQALTPANFGNTDAYGNWEPVTYTGTYGTNGFYLKFSDATLTSGANTGLGADSSGNGNYWTTNNISVTAGTTYDAMTDVPTNTSATVANYAVLNPLQRTPGGTGPTLANLKWAIGVADWYSCFASMAISSGKYYWEITNSNLTSSSTYTTIGITNSTAPLGVGQNAGSDANSWVYYSQNGNKINNGSQVAYGAAYVSNDIVGVAYDADNGKLYFSKNGTFQASGDPAAGTNAAYTGLSGTFFPVISELNSAIDINFGQRPFTYTPPSGFVALNTYNLTTPTILQGNLYMDATTYGAASPVNRVIVNQAGFRPDLVWIKSRTQAYNHYLFDSNRGTASGGLSSSNTSAQNWDTGTQLSSFNSNGYTISSGDAISDTSAVAWQWQAGSSTVTNTSGSISSQVRANTTAGFSIATFTGASTQGATFGHGLGVAPKMVIAKSKTGSTQNWWVYHASLGYTNNIYLNSTAAAFADGNTWLATPSSTLVTIGDNFATSATYVAYCWAQIAGFSAFGSYTGNGNANGPFVYLGFRPKFILVKSTGTASWFILDTARLGYNSTNNYLLPNSSGAETTYNGVDILSNGFKVRNTDSGFNDNGVSYIYAAFAENPFKYANAR